MRLSILGHVEASVDDRPIALGGAKQRAVLAMLGLEANRAVSAERLIEGLWGDEPPTSASKMVQNYVWRLRRVLEDDGGAEIVTRGRGYELRIDRELVDACRLEQLVSEAARGAETGESVNGAAREALALFRGDPLADVADEPFATAEIRRLEELRLTAAELAIETDLATGHHQEVVGEIDALLVENPLRERLHAQRMLALYRCGRQAEALEAYRDARRTLIDEIGIEPTPELRQLHDAILAQDPALDVEPAIAALPPELDAAASPPLIGRDDEVRRLREHWLHAAAGAGALVTLAGPYGMGKTRLAAALASEAHRDGAAVVYAAGTGPPEGVPAAIARARAARRPTLIVIDGAERVPADLRAGLRELGRLPVLVLATGQETAALARLEPRDAIALEPLDAEAVRSIAGFYAPAGGADSVPVETLLANSRGVPRRVHEVAREWARHEATRRVDAAADRAAAGRTEARALDAELVGSVVDLQSVRERAGDEEQAGAPLVCPYKGLATFHAEDAEYFFGREQLVAELVSRLVGAPLLAIVGPSGSGKSSVLRAGLLPALAGGVLPGSANWTQALIRPGDQPLRELRRATRKLDRERSAVLAVDQFEELFTVCADETERAEFIAELVRTARECVVVLTIRADFYGRCAAYPELSRLLGANNVLVGPMSRDELRRAIERPAQRVGLTVEPELVDALLTDVEGRPGALPLLSTALLELWSARDGSRLRLAAYARSGGVQGAVARLAEDAFVRLDPEQQVESRNLMLRLADEDESGAIVRRRIELAELDGERSREVVNRLADRRLLTVSDGSVEVAHEALLREWPRLRAWLDEDVEGRRLHRGLREAARAWDADGRDAGGLYRGARLASALEWAAGHEGELNATERVFLDEGRRASGRAQRRLRMVLAGVASLLVLAVIAGLVALDQRGRAHAEATAAAAQGLGARALSERELDRALLLARQGLALDDSLQTRGNLLATLLESPAAIAVLHGDGDGMTSVALSPDDRTLAFVDTDGTLRRLDARTLRPLARPQAVPVPDEWVDLRFSDDGTRLAAGGGEATILDPRTQRVHASVGTRGRVYGTRFSPDGRTLFAIVQSYAGYLVQRFDARSGRPLDEPVLVSPASGHQPSLQVTRDGRRVVTSVEDGPTMIRDARTLRPLKRLRLGSSATALSPDGRTLLAAGPDGSVRFVDLVSGHSRMASGRHDAVVLAAAFSSDGRTAFTGGEDSRVIVWDVGHATARETLTGHSGVISSLAISSDGRTLYGAVLDGKVLVWDLAGDRRPGRRFGIGPGRPAGPWMDTVASHALSPDGRVLAVGQRDGSVVLLDARTLRMRSRFSAVPDGAVAGMAYMPGGRLLAVGGASGFLAVVDPRRGEIVRRLRGHSSSVRMPSFSNDGRLMATASANTVMVWRLRSGRPFGPAGGQLHRYSLPAGITAASLSPDGRNLAVASEDGVGILDAATLMLRATLQPPGPVYSVRFTPDGRHLAVGHGEGWSQIVSTDTWRPVGGRLAGHSAEVMALSVSRDGRTLATGSADGTIRLFDLATRRPLGVPLPAVTNRLVEPRFTPDGAFLFAFTETGQAYRWDMRPSSWARRACAVAGRTLTRAEWKDVLPGRDYAPACR